MNPTLDANPEIMAASDVAAVIVSLLGLWASRTVLEILLIHLASSPFGSDLVQDSS